MLSNLCKSEWRKRQSDNPFGNNVCRFAQSNMAIYNGNTHKMQNKSLPLQSKTIDKHSKNKEEEKK